MTAEQITITRQPNRFYAVRVDGVKAGEALKEVQ